MFGGETSCRFSGLSNEPPRDVSEIAPYPLESFVGVLDREPDGVGIELPLARGAGACC